MASSCQSCIVIDQSGRSKDRDARCASPSLAPGATLRRPESCTHFSFGSPPHGIDKPVPDSGLGVGESKVWVERDGLTVNLVGIERVQLRSGDMTQLVRLQIQQIGFRIIRRLDSRAGLLLRRQFRLQLLGDRARCRSGWRKHPPDRGRRSAPTGARRSGHRSTARSPAPSLRALHTSFEKVGDTSCSPDLAQVAHRAAAILHDARAADHLEISDLRQVGQDFVLHAIGKIGVRFLLAQVLEGQHGDALFRNGRGGLPGLRRGFGLPGRNPPGNSA